MYDMLIIFKIIHSYNFIILFYMCKVAYQEIKSDNIHEQLMKK
jgi:hypothetical protein